jgi:CRP-like cAMP-binding protein
MGKYYVAHATSGEGDGVLEYMDVLMQTKLFAGIPPEEITGLLDHVHARRAAYGKGDLIIEEGNRVREFGILLSGHGRSFKWDAADRQIIITLLQKGSEIGVLLAASPEHESPVSVQALDDASVLLFSYDNMLAGCEQYSPQHERLLRNYIGIVAEKGLILHERIDCLLKPTLRKKIMNYLRRVSREEQSRVFSIPMNRNAMAEYLNIERSALSRELSYMKRNGLIDYHRNCFQLI